MPKTRPAVRLICWKEDRAVEIAGDLEAGGFTVHSEPVDGPALRALGQAPPEAVVIDLGRLPAQGRDVGVVLRTTAKSRHTPLVFVDGTKDKFSRTREVLPDATYTTRQELAQAVHRAIAAPLPDPVVPDSIFAAYSSTPLLKKLGIKVGSTVAAVDAPADVESILGDLPENTALIRRADPRADVTLWFLRSRSELETEIGRMAKTSGDGRLWICWPKKSSGIASDITQNVVRSAGLEAGLVDFKICAIDSTWSGLCFTNRKK